MGNLITEDDIDHAVTKSPWDLGDEVLYSLCRAQPKHDRADAIIAKVWLIGRAYAAAIERGKPLKCSSEEYYETVVAKKIKTSGLDQWLSSLPKGVSDPWKQLGQVVDVHKRLTDLFTDMTGLEKRALASKYLHFHRPDVFFIYDSRAKRAAGKLTPSIRKISAIDAKRGDYQYVPFVRRCQWIRDEVARRFNVPLTIRQLDRMLLRVAGRLRKPRTRD